MTPEEREEYKKKHHDSENKMKKSDMSTRLKEMIMDKRNMSDEHKFAIHERVAQMKAFKEELRDKSSELTNEEKQQLREEFIEKAKSIQSAWISPRAQINAGVDITEIECREGFNLVMKSNNGIPMCLKSDTALKMIGRGLAAPAN